MIRKKTVILIGLFFIIHLMMMGIIALLNANKSITEQWYSNGFYLLLVEYVTDVSSLVPVSLTEIFFFGWIFLSCFFFIRGIQRTRTKQISRLQALGRCLLYLFISVSLVFWWFEIFWGFNYFRLPLTEKPIQGIHFDEEKLKDESLFFQKMEEYIQKLNQSYCLKEPMKEEDLLPYETDVLNALIENEMQAVIFPQLLNILPEFSSPYKTLISRLIMIFNRSGMTSPFFLEHLISEDLFYGEIPFVLAHEKAHLAGFTSEAECNFIAYLTTIRSSDPFVRYSGYFRILPHFFRVIASQQELYEHYSSQIRPEILQEYQAIVKRKDKYPELWLDISRKMNDLYLKANQVQTGVDNYNEVVELIIGFDL